MKKLVFFLKYVVIYLVLVVPFICLHVHNHFIRAYPNKLDLALGIVAILGVGLYGVCVLRFFDFDVSLEGWFNRLFKR